MKKDQNLPNKNIHSNNSSGKPLPRTPSYSRNQSPYNSNYRGRSPEQRNSRNFSQKDIIDRIVESTILDQIQTQHNLFDHVPNQTQGIDTIPMTDHEIHPTSEIRTVQKIEIEVTQIIEIRITQTIDHKKTHTIDQTIRDQMTTIKIDHEIILETETQVITIDTEIIPSHLIGIITVIPILNIDIEVTHQSINDKSIKYRQMKKQLQTLQVLITQKLMNYN